MTFSLRTLLLLFPALIVSYGLAQGCWPAVQSHSGGRPIWAREALKVRHLQRIAEETLSPGVLASQAATINDYFQGKAILPPALPAAWDALFGKPFILDDWGNPYRCVMIDERLHFYSCGQDRISQSDGNDPDDVNSWNESSSEFYIQQSSEAFQRKRRLEALWFMPLTLAFVIGCWVKLRKPAA